MNRELKGLLDATRRETLKMLRDKEVSVGETASQFNVSKPAIASFVYYQNGMKGDISK